MKSKWKRARSHRWYLGYSSECAQCDLFKKKTTHITQGMDTWLETRTFFVGERISVADITLVATLLPLYQVCGD